MSPTTLRISSSIDPRKILDNVAMNAVSTRLGVGGHVLGCQGTKSSSIGGPFLAYFIGLTHRLGNGRGIFNRKQGKQPSPAPELAPGKMPLRPPPDQARNAPNTLCGSL